MKGSTLAIIGGILLLLAGLTGEGRIPGPGPVPTPDVVMVDSAPFPSERLSVLVVRDTSAPLSAEQAQIVFGGEVRQWLKSQGAESYFLDPATDVSRMPENWQKAMKVDRKSLPWLLVSNRTRGFSGPLPGTVAEFKALVERLK